MNENLGPAIGAWRAPRRRRRVTHLVSLAAALLLAGSGIGQGAASAPVERAALVGVVVDGQGKPVRDAKVEVFECLGRGFACFDQELRGPWTPVAVSSVDKQGRFGVQVPAGAVLRVQVRHERFALWRVDEHVLTKELHVELAAPCTFRGRLVDAATGAGIAGELRGYAGGVTEHFAGHTEIFRGRTDAAGNFAFGQLPPGRFTCMVDPDSHVSPPWWKGELRADAVCEHDFPLATGITLRGRVLEASTQRPIAGACIGEGWYFGRPVRSGVDGTFALAGLDVGGTEVACRAEGFLREFHQQEATERDATHDFVLAPGGSVMGTIVDGEGRAVAGVYVAAAAFGRSVTWIAQRTAADGTFRCAGLPSGGYLVVRAADRAFAAYHLPPPDAEGRIDIGTLSLQPGSVLRATVRDADGKPLAFVRMRLFGLNADFEALTGQPLLGFGEGRQLADRFAYSDGDGVVCFAAVAAGRYHLGFDAEPMPMVPAHAIEVEVTAAGAPKDLSVKHPR